MKNSLEKTGIELIAAERARQIEEEGWTPEHDDNHTIGELSLAGGCYAVISFLAISGHETDATKLRELMIADGSWPFDEKWIKVSSDSKRNLVKAGALIAAEIDRLQRQEDAGDLADVNEVLVNTDSSHP